jgi:hypothetical protein
MAEDKEERAMLLVNAALGPGKGDRSIIPQTQKYKAYWSYR